MFYYFCNALRGALAAYYISQCTCMEFNLNHFYLQVFGGTGFPFGRACSNKCYLFWPYSNPRQITLLETTGDKPDPQYGQAIMLRDTYLYAIGGTTGFEYSCDIYR